MYVLDSNIVIYYFKRRGRVWETFSGVDAGELVLPTLVVYELQTGIKKAGEPRRRVRELQQLTESVRVVDFDVAAANAAALVRAYLESQGAPIGAIDTLIAGVALSSWVC
ncbi:MAG: PIN domain-containing protein [Geitlerinemataceae cyanobacterium]